MMLVAEPLLASDYLVPLLAGRGRREAPGKGSLREPISQHLRGSSPSPQPSRRKSGRGR